MDSTAQTVLGFQKASTKLLLRVTHAFESANSHVDLEIINENGVAGDSKIINESASTGDAWIRQRKQPLRPPKSSSKVLPQLTHDFDSTNSPYGLKNLQRNWFDW